MKEKLPITRRDFLKMAQIGFAATVGPRLGIEGEANPSYTDVLNAETQAALSAKAMSLISLTPEAAIRTADRLRNSTQSSANNICGPLAMDQLIHTVTSGVRAEDFMEAPIPRNDNANFFDVAFLPLEFDKMETRTMLKDYDFNTGMGIQPGDFLYFVGDNRGYSHMITISRRGRGGVLYAITNYPGPDKEYIIKEVPFWNPDSPESSWAKELGRGENSVLFSSGEGGFFQWRLKKFQPSFYDVLDKSAGAETLRHEVFDLAHTSSGEWYVLITNLSTGKTIAESGSRINHHVASVFKVPLAMVFMKYLEGTAKNELDLRNTLSSQRREGKTFDRLMRAMLVESSEDATAILADYLAEKKYDKKAALKSFGAENTILGSRNSNAEDMALFFGRLYSGKSFRFPSTSAYLLDLLSAQTPEDATRLGTIRENGVGIRKIYSKRGSIALEDLVVVADTGIVEVVDGRGKVTPYFVSLSGTQRKDKKASYRDLEAELLQFTQAFSDFAKRS